jgi:MFS family permease
MSLFMTLGFQALGAAGLLAIGTAYLIACLKVADYFKTRALNVPAGILATLAITLVPLVVWCLQSLLGLWPPGASHSYSDYHLFVNWRWTTLEFATLAAAVVMLWRYKLPFMVMPVAVTVWYMSMDVAHALMQYQGFDWKFARDVSVVFGLATLALAVWVDIRTRRSQHSAWRQDFSFWLYLLGTVMFWGGLSLRDSESEWGKLLYAALNVALIFGGAVIRRRVLTVFGAFGVAGYLGYLSHRVFQDSLLFPFALTFLGLAVVGLGVWWQRNEAAIERRMNAFVPQGLRQPR